MSAPTSQNYERVLARLEDCKTLSCRSKVAPDSVVIERLVGLVAKNNQLAVDIAFASRECLDGGDLEDLTRSLALVADSNPHLFLTEANKHDLGFRPLKVILGMVPESVIDDMCKRKSLIGARVASLRDVADPELAAARGIALDALRQVLNEIPSSDCK